MLVTKIAFTAFVVLLVTGVITAQFGSPYPRVVTWPDVVGGACLILAVVALVVGLIAAVWGF